MAEKVNRVQSGKVSWVVPNMGVVHGVPSHTLPPNALHTSLNVCIRDGLLVPRPGMTLFASTVLVGRPTGSIGSNVLGSGAFQDDAFQEDAFQVDSSIPATLSVVGTTKRLYVFYNGMYNDITGSLPSGSDLGGSADNPSRFTGLPIGSPPQISIVHSNGIDTPRVWALGDPSFVTMPDAPLWKDLTTISDRIIGLVGPYEIRWGESLDLDNFPVENSRTLADTTDATVAITNFGTTGGAVYKSNSIWNVVVTDDPVSSRFFRFDFKIQVEGPASAPALVNAQKAHYYMTRNGRVGRWDGYAHEWVADGAWPLIRADLDTDFAGRIHGAYEPTHDEIIFYYPRVGDNGECKGIHTVTLPRPMNNLTDHIGFPGMSSHPISTATSLVLDLKKILVFTSDVATVGAKAYLLEGQNDDAERFTGYWQPGLAMVEGPNPARIGDCEAFFERGPGYGTVTIKAVVSDILDNAGGRVVEAGQTIDLSKIAIFDLKTADARGRFIGTRFEFRTPVTIRYKGLDMRNIDRA